MAERQNYLSLPLCVGKKQAPTIGMLFRFVRRFQTSQKSIGQLHVGMSFFSSPGAEQNTVMPLEHVELKDFLLVGILKYGIFSSATYRHLYRQIDGISMDYAGVTWSTIFKKSQVPQGFNCLMGLLEILIGGSV